MDAESALLVMDYQIEIVERYSGDQCAETTAAVVSACRSAGIQVIFVRVGFRPGYPEVHPLNRGFQAAKKSGRFLLDDPSTEIDLRIRPTPSEVVITKTRVSAFCSTGLDQLLRAQGIQKIVLAGIATSGVILSTVRDAADLDYGVTVLSDCCTDVDSEVHEVLMTKIFPRQALVMDASTWTQALKA